MLFTILFGFIPLVFALVGGSFYFIECIISTVRTILTRRKIKKQVKNFVKILAERTDKNGD